jgi:hypothetical protein
MTAEIVLAARSARGLPETVRLREQRARGRPGARCTRGLACNVHRRMRTRAYRFSGEHPAFPAQWLYGLYEFALVTGFLATIALQIALPNLTPAPGRQAHTTSPYASDHARQSQPSRPPLPAPRLRRWPTPLFWDRMAGVVELICPTRPAKYFCAEGWTYFL